VAPDEPYLVVEGRDNNDVLLFEWPRRFRLVVSGVGPGSTDEVVCDFDDFVGFFLALKTISASRMIKRRT